MRLWFLPTYVLGLSPTLPTAHPSTAARMVVAVALGCALAISERVQAKVFYGGVEDM